LGPGVRDESGFELRTKLETNEQMLKMPDNSVYFFLKVLMALSPQEEGDRRGRRSHLKPVGRRHERATERTCSSVKPFLI